MTDRILKIAVLVVGCVTLAGCASKPPMPNAVVAYQTALAELKARPTLTAGSEAEKAAIQRFSQLFTDLSAVNVQAHTRDVYAADAYFNDTLKTLHGSAEVEKYFLQTSENATTTVKIEEIAVHDGNYYVRWVMDIQFKKFKKKEICRSIGMTHIRFNEEGKVALHQDYWDAAGGFFEHVPVVGAPIRYIKKHL